MAVSSEQIIKELAKQHGTKHIGGKIVANVVFDPKDHFRDHLKFNRADVSRYVKTIRKLSDGSEVEINDQLFIKYGKGLMPVIPE